MTQGSSDEQRKGRIFRYELLTFDLDGTLVDTATEIAEAANRTLDAFGVTRQPVADISKLIGFGMRDLMLKLWKHSLLKHPETGQQIQEADVLACVEEQYALVAGTTATPYTGCRELLTSIRGAGVRMACVTNKELRHTRQVLSTTGLESHFDLVIGGDSLAEKKPHPNVLQHVARSLNADLRHTAHLGDSNTDVAAARNSGVEAWAVSYGYNGGIPVAASNPDQLFASLQDVHSFLFSN